MTFNRRKFLGSIGMAAAGLSAMNSTAAESNRFPIAFFEKPLQKLPAAEMARVLKGIGFAGVEATIRKGGRIAPERAADELPAYVEALSKERMRILVMATSIRHVDQAHAEATLRAAAKLGVRTYRLAGESYDLKKPLMAQLGELQARWKDLADINRELGLTAVYQNHAGAKHVGAPIWDLHHVLRDIDPGSVGVAFDIRHAMVEGSTSWPIDYELIRPWIKAVYVKDFVFSKGRARNVAMGTGVVGKGFYERLKVGGSSVPVSLHCPHVPSIRGEGEASTVVAIEKDFRVLKRLLRGA